MNYTIEDLKKMTVTELKSIAYDLLSELQRVQNFLNIVNEIISEKSKKDVKEEKK